MKNITNSECNAKPCLQGNVFMQCASSEVVVQSLSDTKPTIHETTTKHAMRIIWIASLHTSNISSYVVNLPSCKFQVFSGI